jgi:REP element-mobilizing transposase RayT
MPQSLHVLSVHIVFSTKERRPWVSKDLQARLWAYQSRILQNLECHSITIGGVEDHVHVACHLSKKVAPIKVLEILKKDSSKFIKTLRNDLTAFHWQDGYGLFSVSPSHEEALRQYIGDQEEHHKKETFREEFVRLLQKYQVQFDERYLWD